MYAVESYAAVRRFVFIEGRTQREAARVSSDASVGGSKISTIATVKSADMSRSVNCFHHGKILFRQIQRGVRSAASYPAG